MFLFGIMLFLLFWKMFGLVFSGVFLWKLRNMFLLLVRWISMKLLLLMLL